MVLDVFVDRFDLRVVVVVVVAVAVAVCVIHS